MKKYTLKINKEQMYDYLKQTELGCKLPPIEAFNFIKDGDFWLECFEDEVAISSLFSVCAGCVFLTNKVRLNSKEEHQINREIPLQELVEKGILVFHE